MSQNSRNTSNQQEGAETLLGRMAREIEEELRASGVKVTIVDSLSPSTQLKACFVPRRIKQTKDRRKESEQE